MRDFSKVAPKIWESDRFKNLADDGAQLAYLYLLSNGHQNSIGCYRLTTGYACDDLGWLATKWDEKLAVLIAAALAETDSQTKEVLIPRWFKHNPPTNAKHAQGAFRLVEKIESPALQAAATAALEAAWSKWQVEHAASSASTSGGPRSSLLETHRMRAINGGR